MSDTPQGPGWWMADDQRWYPPEQRAGESTAPPLPGPPPLPVTPPPFMPARQGPTATSVGSNRRVVVAGLVLLALIVGAVVVLVTQKSDDTPIASTPTSTTSLATTTAPVPVTTALASTTVAPTTVAPSTPVGPGNVLTEPVGLFCKDLKAKGYSYSASVDYWRAHGQPDNMDADKNGIPCETAYPTADVTAYWGPQLPVSGSGVDLSSPLLNSYQTNESNYYLDHTAAEAAKDLGQLQSETGVSWTMEMLLALGASYCNDWPTVPDPNGGGPLSSAGKQKWASGIAPALGISTSVALKAIESNIWSNYQLVCE